MPATVTPQTWAASLLAGLGAPITPANIKAIVGWEHAEGGHWNNTATYNPLNATQVPTSGTYSNTGTQGNIKAYSSWQQGLAATIVTLQNGAYGGILSALHAGNNPQAVAAAIGSSPWGTSGSLAASTIAGASEPAVHALPTPSISLAGVPGAAGVQAIAQAAGGLGIPNPLSGIDAIAALLTSLDFWKRLGEVIAGIILVAMGLRSLTGGSVDPIEVATAAAAKVRPA